MIHIYYGPEKYLSDRVRWEKSASGAEVFDGLTEEFFMAASSLPLFSFGEGERTFVVTSKEPEKDFTACAGRLAGIEDDVFLFRDAVLPSAVKPLSSLGFTLHECEKLREPEAIRLIEEVAGKCGTIFDADAARYLLILTDYLAGGDLYDVVREAERLSFAGEHVTLADVKAYGNETRGAQVFRMTDALLSGNAGAALPEMERLLADRGFSGLATIGLIERSVRLSYKELILKESGMKETDQRAVLGIPRLVPILPRDQLVKCLHVLSEARNACKTGRMKEDMAFRYVIGAILNRENLPA